MPELASDSSKPRRVPAFAVDGGHRLLGARHLDSPHQDERPQNEISLLVIHAISLPPGEFGDSGYNRHIDQLFMGTLDSEVHPYFASIQGLRVSSHLCIFRDGSVTQYVPFDRRAWHAGESQFEGRSRCNDFSVGIELEGDDLQPFADAQYASLAGSIRALLSRYHDLAPSRITGHSDIAPGRKTDPGPHFDWPRLRASLDQS